MSEADDWRSSVLCEIRGLAAGSWRRLSVVIFVHSGDFRSSCTSVCPVMPDGSLDLPFV